MKFFITIFALLIIYSTGPLASNDGAINDSSVADILEKLRKQPSAVFNQHDGWTIVSLKEEGNQVTWFFAPEENSIYPAVIKKIITEKQGGIETVTTTICDAPKAKCDSLIKQFKNINAVHK